MSEQYDALKLAVETALIHISVEGYSNKVRDILRSGIVSAEGERYWTDNFVNRGLFFK